MSSTNFNRLPWRVEKDGETVRVIPDHKPIQSKRVSNIARAVINGLYDFPKESISDLIED
jgi:hypothetical protein